MTNTAENFYKTNNNTDEDDIFAIDSPEEATDGIALLVSMAKTGKIDPWDIDIVDVADKYLLQMAEKKASNLRNTGRTIWLASVLLKLKSNVLVGLDPMDFDSVMAQEDFEEYNDDFEPEYEQPVRKNNVVSINEALKRRLSTRMNRKRTVTLKDLIKQLKFYEELDKKQAIKNTLERAKRRAVRSYENLSTSQIVNLAAEDHIKKNIAILKTKLEQIFLQDAKVELNDLTEIGMDRLNAYLALLFITRDTDIELVQEEFYGDLYIQKENKSAENVDNTEKQEISEIATTVAKKHSGNPQKKNNSFVAYELQGGMRNNVVSTPPVKEAVIAS